MELIRWLAGLWYAYQRRIDLAILWPSCRERAPTLDLAKVIFTGHAYRDEAWLCLPEEEMLRIIDGLR